MNPSTTVRVRDVSDLVTKGTTPTSLGRKFTSSGVNFLKVETFAGDGKFIPGREAFIDASTHQLLKRSQLDKGDILFSIAGALGRSTVVEEAWLPANTNQALAIIRPAKIRRSVLPRYLLWQLRSSAIMQRIAEINVQAAQANLSLEQVRDFEIPLVPLPEQKAITAALDDVDESITTLERLIAKKQAIKQGMLQQLLTGRIRLAGFADEWVSRPFPEVMFRVRAKKHQIPASSYSDVGRLPVVDQGQKPIIGYTDQMDAAFDPGDDGVIVFGDHTRVTKFVDFKFAVGADGTQVVKATSGNSTRFFAHALKADPVANTGYNRHFKFLREKVLPAPGLTEQQAVADVLDDADREIEALEARLAKARDIKQGMMQQLLTGRTRLFVEVAS